MASLNPELKGRDVLINSVMGLCGESGEAIDIVKKWLAQGHPLDRERGGVYRRRRQEAGLLPDAESQHRKIQQKLQRRFHYENCSDL